MKKIILLFILITFGFRGYNQNFRLLTNDASGDPTQSFAPDIKSLSFDMDIAQDSIWFKVESYTPVSPDGDAGMIFGFDTNSVITDGLPWNGNNNSLHYDQSLLIFQDAISPNYYGYTYNLLGSLQVPVIVSRPDSFTFIIRTKLSALDNDGNFNLIFGTGAFDILSTRSVYDEAPDTGYLVISPVLGISPVTDSKKMFSIYPNPCYGNKLYVLTNENSSQENYIIYGNGKMVLSGITSREEPIEISVLKPGIYTIMLSKDDLYFSDIVFIRN